MNLINQMIKSESNPKLNIDGTEKVCNCENCKLIIKNQTVEYPPLTEEEIEQIVKERYYYKDEKTKKFIRKALRKHDDRYDYSNVIYLKSDVKVEIMCRIEGHNSFSQTPENHLQGQGCSICGYERQINKQRKTKEEFIREAKEIHGDKYDYSKVNYVGCEDEVIIICPKHGEFPQIPLVHLNGSGCPKCNSSKGEIAVRNYLIENEINFIEQKKFKDCKDKYPLPFDFYVTNYNLCIEFDGLQHFMIIKRSKKMTDKQAKENFKIIQSHDQIKNEYCNLHNINLLRIRYNENVEEKLTEYFQRQVV